MNRCPSDSLQRCSLQHCDPLIYARADNGNVSIKILGKWEGMALTTTNDIDQSTVYTVYKDTVFGVCVVMRWFIDDSAYGLL
jgi:hypothetical protein